MNIIQNCNCDYNIAAVNPLASMSGLMKRGSLCLGTYSVVPICLLMLVKSQ